MGKAGALAIRRLRPVPVPVQISASWAADFGLAVNPEQIVAHRAWRVARACAHATIEAGSGLVVVLGGPGTGKSLLLRELARQLEAGGREVRLVQRGDMVGEPLTRGIELVDEADHIDPLTLGRLVAARDAVHVLAALPRFAEQLSGFGTPMTVVALAPLTAQGVDDFVTRRLAAAGRSVDLVSRPAMAMLAEHSGGIPRVINMLVGAAISLAAAEGAYQVGSEHVEQAVTLRDGFAPRPSATVTALPGVFAAKPKPEDERAVEPVVEAVPMPPPAERHVTLLPALFATVALFATLFAGLALHANIYPSRTTVMSTAAAPEAPAVVPLAVAEPVIAVDWAVAGAPDLSELAAIEPAAGAMPAESSPRVQPAATDAVEVAAVSLPPPAAVVVPPAPGPKIEPVALVLPATPTVRVRIQYARGDADTAARANRQAEGLRAAGFAVEAPAALARAGGQPGIRYYFADDRDAAAEVARRLEAFAGDIRLAAPARRDALPRPGTVEVLLPAR
jgi:hypothetical protein